MIREVTKLQVWRIQPSFLLASSLPLPFETSFEPFLFLNSLTLHRTLWKSTVYHYFDGIGLYFSVYLDRKLLLSLALSSWSNSALLFTSSIMGFLFPFWMNSWNSIMKYLSFILQPPKRILVPPKSAFTNLEFEPGA